MLSTTLLLSQKCQIVLPKAIREQLGLKAGMRVSIQAIDEKNAIITAQPEDYVVAMRGLGKNIWKKLDGTDRYLKRERASWGKR